MNLTLVASLISAAAAGAAGFGLAWRLQTATINKMELDDANQRISLQRAARQTIERQQNAVVVAQDAAALREYGSVGGDDAIAGIKGLASGSQGGGCCVAQPVKSRIAITTHSIESTATFIRSILGRGDCILLPLNCLASGTL